MFKIAIIIYYELIVTQWDVNKVGFVQIPADAVGINSYIVGCKYMSLDDNLHSVNRINSYIVGCKYRLYNHI